MATKRKSTRQPKQRGSTLYGALAGLLIGLVIAAVVAFYVTKAPMPFVDRASREPSRTRLIAPEAPIGWPRARAPPPRLIRASGNPVSLAQAMA